MLRVKGIIVLYTQEKLFIKKAFMDETVCRAIIKRYLLLLLFSNWYEISYDCQYLIEGVVFVPYLVIASTLDMCTRQGSNLDHFVAFCLPPQDLCPSHSRIIFENISSNHQTINLFIFLIVRVDVRLVQFAFSDRFLS